MTSAEKPGDLLDTVRSTLFASVPALGVLVFLIVAVKVFRAAHMETATTVAVVSSADPVALLKGVVLTLLPGFLTAVVAAGIWWWVGDTPSGSQALDPAATARTALFRPRTLLVWSLLVMAFFTISWPVFLVLAVPVIAHTILLTGQSIGRWQDAGLARTLPSTVRATGLIAAVVSVGWLALSPTVWLPLRLVHLDARHTTATQGMPLPTEFGAFILSRKGLSGSRQ